MKHTLSSIITYGTTYAGSVDPKKLFQHTRQERLALIDGFNWHRVKELHILEFVRTSVEYAHEKDPLIGCHVDNTDTWVLLIGATADQIHTVLNQCGSALKLLDLRCPAFDELDVSRMINLEKLCVSGTKFKSSANDEFPIRGLNGLSKLVSLDLSFTDCMALPALPVGLKHLDLSGNPGLAKVKNLSELHELEELDLSCTDVDYLDLSGQSNLRRLRMVDTRRLSGLAGIENNESLEYLDLSHSALKQLPDGIYGLKKLIHLDISHLKLHVFPDGLSAMEMDYTYCDNGINLRGTKIMGADFDIFDRVPPKVITRDDVQEWFSGYRNKVDRPLKEVKIIFLGNGEAGKTHTIARLLNDGGDPLGYTHKTTPGVQISTRLFYVGGSGVKVHFWDFGGQEHLFPIHFPFLTEDALYVVMLDAGSYPDTQAHYWLNIIKTCAGKAPVLLVLNKTDTTVNPGINESGLREEYKDNIRGFVKMSAMYDDRETIQKGLISQIKTVLGEMQKDPAHLPPLWRPFRHSWHLLRDVLREKNEQVISREEFEREAAACEIEADRYAEVLEVFSNVGFSYFSHGSPEQEKYVVLDPNWLTNALYTIAFNQSVLHAQYPQVQSGIITHGQICWILDPNNAKKYPIERVLPDTSYVDYLQYLLELMHRYKLSVALEADVEFMPLLCRWDMPAGVIKHERHYSVIKYVLHYRSLVRNLIHHLMIERCQELDLDYTWNAGARFVRQADGSSAVVREDGACIRIFAVEQEDQDFEERFGKQLADDLKRISNELHLSIQQRSIICEVLVELSTEAGKKSVVATEEIELEEFSKRISNRKKDIYSTEWKEWGWIMDSRLDSLGDEESVDSMAD